MSGDYRIERTGDAFMVTDPSGQWVDLYPTEDAARQDIERCKKEDSMWETAKLLVDISITANQMPRQ
jgi:hypothetical protein